MIFFIVCAFFTTILVILRATETIGVSLFVVFLPMIIFGVFLIAGFVREVRRRIQ
jgi:hypothetical protein